MGKLLVADLGIAFKLLVVMQASLRTFTLRTATDHNLRRVRSLSQSAFLARMTCLLKSIALALETAGGN